MDKLAEYRRQQAERYAQHVKILHDEKEKEDKETNEKVKLLTFFSKYDFEYNKESLAAFRIARFAKRHLLKSTINELLIPGRFKYRINTKKLLTSDIFNIINEIEDNDQKLIMEIDLLSYYESVLSNDFNYMIDISLYTTSDMPIMIEDEMYYLSTSEKDKINKIWEKINPETEIGKQFHSLLDFSKALSDAYNLSK
jgi:hypothetical protein